MKLADAVAVLAVLRVVDRVRLRHPDDRAVHDVARPCASPSCSELRGASSIRSASELLPQAVTLEAEVLEPRQVCPGVGHHRLAPVVEILDAADLHARRVDVDPVVGEQVLAARGSARPRGNRDTAGPRPPLAPLGAAPATGRARASARGIVEMTWSAAKRLLAVRRLGAHRDDAPVPHLDAVDLVPHEHLVAHRLDRVAAHLPHLAGAEPRILELVDQRLDRRSSACSATPPTESPSPATDPGCAAPPTRRGFRCTECPRPSPCRS